MQHSNSIGIDEAGRGPLIGRVYASAVYWPQNILPEYKGIKINDSKKLSREKRKILLKYIKSQKIPFAVGYASVKEINKYNILQATFMAMHRALDKLSKKIDIKHIIVDGNRFKSYNDIPHECHIKGDGKYIPIACASIIAKEYHDKHIRKLCNRHPDLNEKYDLLQNMGYGTVKHRKGITENGISKYHRNFNVKKVY